MKSSFKLSLVIILLLPLLFSQCKKLIDEPVCNFPESVSITNVTNNSADATWASSEDARQYLFEYRKLGTTNYTVLRITSGTSAKVTNLASGTTYQYRVQSNCPGSNSNYTEVKQFKTVSNNQFNILRKWRMKFFKENNVEVALGSSDFMNFEAGGALTQSLTIGGSPVVASGTWELLSNNDSVKINLSSSKRWKISTLNPTDFLLTKNATAPLNTIDSIRFEAF